MIELTEFEQYTKYLEDFHQSAFDIMKSKAQDYTGGENPLLNFVNAAEMTGITIEQGLIYMMCIKLTRARVLTEKGSLVGQVGEKISDTLKDLSNYAGILGYYADNNYNSAAVNQLELPFQNQEQEPTEEVTNNWSKLKQALGM